MPCECLYPPLQRVDAPENRVPRNVRCARSPAQPDAGGRRSRKRRPPRPVDEPEKNGERRGVEGVWLGRFGRTLGCRGVDRHDTAALRWSLLVRGKASATRREVINRPEIRVEQSTEDDGMLAPHQIPSLGKALRSQGSSIGRPHGFTDCCQLTTPTPRGGWCRGR